MATIPQILMHVWPGNEWTLREDDYATLEWSENNVDQKPSEADIRSHSEDVDRIVARLRAMRDREEYGDDAAKTVYE